VKRVRHLILLAETGLNLSFIYTFQIYMTYGEKIVCGDYSGKQSNRFPPRVFDTMNAVARVDGSVWTIEATEHEELGVGLAGGSAYTGP
jgi:hypothetical protein